MSVVFMLFVFFFPQAQATVECVGEVSRDVDVQSMDLSWWDLRGVDSLGAYLKGVDLRSELECVGYVSRDMDVQSVNFRRELEESLHTEIGYSSSAENDLPPAPKNSPSRNLRIFWAILLSAWERMPGEYDYSPSFDHKFWCFWDGFFSPSLSLALRNCAPVAFRD